MNEIKNIKEIAKIIDKSKKLYVEDYGSISMYYTPDEYFAKKIIEEGYRNCKDKVVLSKEEWKQIKNSLYYSREALERKLEKARKETAKEIIDKVDDMIGGKMIAQALKEIYEVKEL